jgi:hypothetical protein
LDRLSAQLNAKLAAFVVFGRPAAQADGIRASSLWKRAAEISGIVRVADEPGLEIESFGGSVSGQTMLYDLNGRLVFQGGITSARGHEGDNSGVDSIISLVRGQSTSVVRTPVFGCSLHDPSRQTLQKEPAWTKQ